MASASAEHPWRRGGDLDDDEEPEEGEVDAGSHSGTDTEEYYNRCSSLSDETITDDGGGETATSSAAAVVPAHDNYPSSSVAWGWGGTGRRGWSGSSARAPAVSPIAVVAEPEQPVLTVAAAVPEVVVLQPMPLESEPPNPSPVPMESAARGNLSGQSGGGAPPAHGDAIAAPAAGAGQQNPKKVYTCKRCGTVFWNPQALGGHVVGHINRDLAAAAAAAAEDSAVVVPGPRRGGKPERLHVCNECGAEFSTGVQLGGHKRKHWTGGPIVPKKKPRVVEPLLPPPAEDVADLTLALPVINAADEATPAVEAAVEINPKPAGRPAAAGRVLLFGIDIGTGKKQTPEAQQGSPSSGGQQEL